MHHCRLLSQESHVSAPIEKEGKPVSEETSADIIVPHSPNGQSEVAMMEANSDSSLKPAEHQMDQSNLSSDSLVDVRLFPKSSPSVGQSDVPKNSPSVGQSDVPKSSPSIGQSDVPKNSPSVGQSESLLTTITTGEAMDTSQHQSMGSDSVHIGVADVAALNVGVSDTAIPTVPDKSENITLNKSADTDLTQIIKEADKLDSPVTLATASRKEEVHNESQAEHARHFIVYHKSCLPDGPVEDMPESFYNVTAEDIHIVRRDLFTQIASSEEKPLMTKIMRQIERFVQFDKYKKVWACIICMEFE